jgi:hypothetical protein
MRPFLRVFGVMGEKVREGLEALKQGRLSATQVTQAGAPSVVALAVAPDA